jgi:ABC-type multidrug transport system ATPase subunit
MLWDEIRQLVSRGKTVLLTTHYLQEADALADRIAVINKGEIIAESTPAEIKAKTSGKRIRCITAISIDQVRQIPGVLIHSERENRSAKSKEFRGRAGGGARCHPWERYPRMGGTLERKGESSTTLTITLPIEESMPKPEGGRN